MKDSLVQMCEKAAELFGCFMDYFVDESYEFAQIPIALRTRVLLLKT